jgi:hypothetical protein
MLVHFPVKLTPLQWIELPYLWDLGEISALSVLGDDVMYSSIGKVHMHPRERQLEAR